MGKAPSQREKEQSRAERVAAAAEAERHRTARRRRASILVVAVIAMTLFGLLLGGNLVDDDEPSAATTSTLLPATTAPTPATAPGPTIAVTLPPAGATISGETPCPATDGSSERVTQFEGPPPTCIDTAKRYKAVMHTNLGDLTFSLHDDDSPVAVNNFVVLSRYHFYDGLPFFRILPGTAMVGGDATGDPEIGEGGPGYTFDDEYPDVGVLYLPGSLHSYTEEPDGNGSRFLIAGTDTQAADLPNMTAMGTMLDGTPVLVAMQRQGDPATGVPTAEIVVESIDIIEEADD